MIHRPSRRPRATARGVRSVARPPTQRRTTGALVGRTARPTGRRTGAVTTRAAIFAVILCSLVLALTYPIRAYVGQRSDIRKLEQNRDEAKLRVDRLTLERAQWEDPAFVEAQARERLRYVKPGEKSLVVIGSAPPAAPVPKPGRPRVAKPDDPWYQQLWSTVEIAGTEPKPAPKPKPKPQPKPKPAPAPAPAPNPAP